MSDKDGEILTIQVPTKDILGTAGINGMNIDRINDPGPFEEIERETERLDSVIGSSITLLKVDVEGFEPAVFRGAKNILSAGYVPDIVFEYSPGVFERAANFQQACRNPETLMALINAGYKLYDLPYWIQSMGYGRQPVYTITRDIVRNDIDDCVRRLNNTFNCPDDPLVRKE